MAVSKVVEIQTSVTFQVVRLAVDRVIFGAGRLWAKFMGDKNYQASLLGRSPLHGGGCKIIPEELSVCLHIGVCAR